MRALALALALVLGACVPAPALVTRGQIAQTFPPAAVEAATRCARRLNAHARAVELSEAVRPVASSSGALLGLAGAAVADLDADAAVGLAVAGTIVAALVEAILRATADPSDLRARHARGLASWDAARREPAARGEHLERCVRDEAPPAAPVLAGEAP